MQLLCALAFGLAATPGQDLDKKISFEITATNARLVVQELSKQSGVPLNCSPVVAPDVLVIRVKDVPIKDLMARIARVTSAEWTQDESGYTLNRTAAKAQQEELAERAAYVEQIRKALEAEAVAASKQDAFNQSAATTISTKARELQLRMQNGAGDLSQDWKQIENLRTSSPLGRLATRLVSCLRAEDLANITIGERRVFSTTPTRMQIPLRNSRPVFESFKREQQVLERALGTPPETLEGEESWLINELLNGSFGHLRPAKALVIVQTWAPSLPMAAEIRLLDETGRVAAVTSKVIGTAPDQRVVDPNEPRIGTDNPIKLSVPSEQFRKLILQESGITEGGQVADAGPVPKELREVLTNPETSDPLQLILGDALLQLGEESKANLVASLPDLMLGYPAPWSGVERLTTRNLMYLAKSNDVLQWRLDTDWLEVMPGRPATCRKLRLDRRALGALARRAFASGTSLDEEAAFALTVPFGAELQATWFTALLPDFNTDGNFDLLRFYGTLTPYQKQAVLASRPVAIGAVQGRQAVLLNRMAFYSNLSLEVQQDVLEGPDTPYMTSRFFSDESTELLPNGIPKDAMLEVEIEKTAVLRSTPRHMHVPPRLGVGEVAGYLAMTERPDLFPDTAQYPKLTQFNLGTNTSFTFKFSFTQTIVQHGSLSDASFSSATVYTLQTLPEGIRKDILKALQDVRDAYKDMKSDTRPADPPGTRPPPPSRTP